MKTALTRIKLWFRTTMKVLIKWDPKPVSETVIDPAIFKRSALERASCILIHTLLRLEFAISPQGVLREWARLCLRLCIMLSLPALLVMPALIVLADGILEITAAATVIFSNLLNSVINIVMSVAIIAAVIAVAAEIMKTRRRR